MNKALIGITHLAIGLSLLTANPTASAQSCRWGLAPNSDCPNLEKAAAQRMSSAKTACLSSDSGVSWEKNLKNPNSAATLRGMHRAYVSARRGYVALTSCPDADLIFKFQVDKGVNAELEVFDSDSGQRVFDESRSITDESADLARLAAHFHHAREEAITMTKDLVTWDNEKQQAQTSH